jgi:hypothetical protein
MTEWLLLMEEKFLRVEEQGRHKLTVSSEPRHKKNKCLNILYIFLLYLMTGYFKLKFFDTFNNYKQQLHNTT